MKSKTSDPPLPLDDRLVIASHQAARAKNFWQIYWFYKSDSDGTFKNLWDRFPFFLLCDQLSHFVSFVVSTSAILEEGRSDTTNVHHLLLDMDAQGLVDPSMRQFVQDELSKIAEIQPKMRILRNKLYAHRDNTRSHEEWLKDAKITFDEMSLYGDVAISIANALCGARGLTEQNPLSEPLDELKQMLRKLSDLPDDDPPFMKVFEN